MRYIPWTKEYIFPNQISVLNTINQTRLYTVPFTLWYFNFNVQINRLIIDHNVVQDLYKDKNNNIYPEDFLDAWSLYEYL